MTVDIANSPPKHPVLFDEMQNLCVRCDTGLRKIGNGIENQFALAPIAQGQFAHDEWVGENRAGIEKFDQGLIGGA